MPTPSLRISSIVSLLASALLSVAVPAFAQTGTITGTVTNAATAAPLANVTVKAFSSTTGNLIASAPSNGSGVYSIQVAAGGYWLRTDVPLFGYNFVNELYNNIPCSPDCTNSTGATVNVTSGGTTPNINFSLTPGGTIDGTITSTASGLPIDGVAIYAYSPTGLFVSSSGTNASGQYSIPLLAGSYYLETDFGSEQSFVDELYNNLTCRPACAVTSGSAVVVTSNTSTPNINFSLASGGTVAGTVTAGTGPGATPLAGAKVGLYAASGALVAEATTSAGGSYAIGALPAGTYRARTFTSGGRIDQIYAGQALCAPGCLPGGGTGIAVTAGNVAGGIDFGLAASTELLQNGTFSAGTANWQLFATPTNAYLESSLINGVFYFRRVPPPAGTSNQAVVFQNTGTAISNNTPLVAQFDAGHLGGTRRRLSVLVHDSDFSDLAVCTFWLQPTATLSRYGIRLHTTKAWANASISIYAASTGPANEPFFIDNVSLQTQPSANVERTDCIDPAGTAAPGGSAGANLLQNGDFASGAVAPGWSTFGQIQSNVTAGVFQFIKLAGAPAGVLLQATNQTMTFGDILTATMDLGNSSNVRKRVTVIVHDNDFSDLAACTFWLPPAQALSSYTMRLATNKAWTNATMSIYPATVGSEQWIRLDNVTLARTPSSLINRTECVETAAGGDQRGNGWVGESAHARGTTGAAYAASSATNAGGVSTGAESDGDRAIETLDATEWLADGFVVADETAPGTAGFIWRAGGGAEARTLTSAQALDVASLASGRLSFESWLSGGSGHARVEVSTNGVDWEIVRAATSSDTWTTVELDLSAYAGSRVFVRLVLDGSPDAVWRVTTPASPSN